MHALLSYFFPIMLIPFEWGLKIILQEDSTSFFGPTIAAAGLSFMIQLTKPKQLGDLNNGSIIISKADNRFVPVLWIIILASLFAWAASCYFSIKSPNYVILNGIPCHFAIGGLVYSPSIVLTFIKERVV